MRLAALIFDLDGTLIDNEERDCEAFIRAFAEFGRPGLTPTDIKAMFGPSADGIIRLAIGDGWESCWDRYRHYYLEALTELDVFPGVLQLMGWAKDAEVRLGLVTGGGEGKARLTLGKLGIDCFGSFTRYGSPEGSVKRQSIEELVREWDLEPSTVGYVGDALGDMRIARDAGVVGLGAAWCSTADVGSLKEAGAAAVFTSPEDIRQWLLDGQGGVGHP